MSQSQSQESYGSVVVDADPVAMPSMQTVITKAPKVSPGAIVRRIFNRGTDSEVRYPAFVENVWSDGTLSLIVIQIAGNPMLDRSCPVSEVEVIYDPLDMEFISRTLDIAMSGLSKALNTIAEIQAELGLNQPKVNPKEGAKK